MAHLALVVDPDPARRERFAAGVRRLFAELPGTAVAEASVGDLTCVWAAGPRAPIDLHRDGDRLALLVGYAVDDAGRWLTARQLADSWLAADGERTAQDSYHVGVAHDPVHGLAVGVDPLGLFPLSHVRPADGVILAATTPQAFLAHPLVPWAVDRFGLAGILLAHGLLDDRPLLAGARRLPTGHRLWVPAGGGPEERPIFEFTGDSPPAGETAAETRERIDELLGGVMNRLAGLCTTGPLPPERQSARVRWDQRVRNHLAAALHLTSFTAWPLTPATDRRFLRAIFGLPVPAFAGRRLEKAILVARRPDLAAIPLDTNSFAFEPLVAGGPRPGPITRAARSLARRLRRAARILRPSGDPRRYERLFDVDQPRWRSVRSAAEPLLPLLAEHLDRRVLAEVLPPPDRRLWSRSPLRAGSPIRLLCGLAFVLDQQP
jgi:hypothetical protein